MTHRRRFHHCLPLVLLLAVSASAEWKERVLYSFQGGTDGATPAGGVVFDSAGNLYGATYDGGADNCPGIAQCGTVYQLTPPKQKEGSWAEHVLYVFKGKNDNDGSTPGGGVLVDKAGNIYGSTSYGGSGSCVLLGIKTGCGTVFELSPPRRKGGKWTEQVLYSFQSGNDGYLPNGDLTFDSAGNLYGVTLFGGGKGSGLCDTFYQYCGTAFKLSPPKRKGGRWTEELLHSFAAGNDGYNPNGGLVLDSKGAIYGTAPMGGNQLCNEGQYKVGCGIVFKLAPTGSGWAEKVLHRFAVSDGAGPNGNLVLGGEGSVFGTTLGGGSSGFPSGTVFRLEPQGQDTWKVDVLYSFTDGNDGGYPRAGVILDAQGGVYGTASEGGIGQGGTLFSLGLASGGSAYVVLHSFTGAPDGSWPAARLVRSAAGVIYGATQDSGTGTGCGHQGCGTVFAASQ